MSSGATKRTSIGKLTRRPSSSIRSRTPSTASTACSRGIAYSSSTKRTTLVLTKIRSLRLTISVRPSETPGRDHGTEEHVREEDLGAPRLVRALLVDGRVRPIVGDDRGLIGVREPVELEMVVLVDQRREVREDAVERARLLEVVHVERGHALKRELRHDAEGTE